MSSRDQRIKYNHNSRLLFILGRFIKRLTVPTSPVTSTKPTKGIHRGREVTAGRHGISQFSPSKRFRLSSSFSRISRFCGRLGKKSTTNYGMLFSTSLVTNTVVIYVAIDTAWPSSLTLPDPLRSGAYLLEIISATLIISNR